MISLQETHHVLTKKNYFIKMGIIGRSENLGVWLIDNLV